MAKEHSIFVDESGDRGGKANGAHGTRISSAMVEHLGFFQSFDGGKAYFGNGQDIVKQARSTQI